MFATFPSKSSLAQISKRAELGASRPPSPFYLYVLAKLFGEGLSARMEDKKGEVADPVYTLRPFRSRQKEIDR